jgi:hypothetical protein
MATATQDETMSDEIIEIQKAIEKEEREGLRALIDLEPEDEAEEDEQ